MRREVRGGDRTKQLVFLSGLDLDWRRQSISGPLGTGEPANMDAL